MNNHILIRFICGNERTHREKNDGDLNRLSSNPERRSTKCRNALLDSFLHDSLRQKSIVLNDEHIENRHNNQVVPKVKQAKQRRLQEIDTTSPISNDELFLMIDDGTGTGTDEIDSNVHVEYRQYYLNKKLDLAIAAAKVSVSSTNALPKQKSISRKLEFDARRQNCFNKRLIKHLCENINQRQKRHRRRVPTNRTHDDTEIGVYNEIDRILLDLQRLTDYEEELMNKLSSKCERYRNQNNKYMTNLPLKLCIDEVQHNLDVYAKEIIENELELHRIQVEIQQKYDVLFNLTKKTGLFNGSNTIQDSDNTFNTSLSNDKTFII